MPGPRRYVSVSIELGSDEPAEDQYVSGLGESVFSIDWLGKSIDEALTDWAD